MSTDISEIVTELLCSRLCHDLISPIGAINNGLEFLAEGDPKTTADAIGLVGASASQAAARLAFYRLAFGHGGGQAHPIPLLEARDTARNFLGDGKVELDWPVPATGSGDNLSRSFGKLALHLFLLGLDALPRGGHVMVTLPAPLSEEWISVIVKGDRCELKDEFRDVLVSNPPAEVMSARNINGYLAARIAAELGLQIGVSGEAGAEIEIAARR